MTGEVIIEYPTMSDDDVGTVLGRAQQAYLIWASADLDERTKVLSRTAELYRQQKE
jgi:acyl-CoA reductase-like NAD-dependent aldehyde dehydrogenase